MVETATPLQPTNERQLAALDLGSNSFHLLVAQESNGRIQVIDKIKEMVRLAEGLDDHNKLNPEVSERALLCLERFSQRLRGLDPADIRVVGTNTLRRARNASSFLKQAERILGVSVEIISGREEARLIYLGVSQALEDNFERRLVVDIGGGSTEVILGRQVKAEFMESLHVGCVGMTRKCFKDGRLRASSFKKAIDLTRQEMEPLVARYSDVGWDTVIGASGTILALRDIISNLDSEHEGITHAGLNAVKEAMIDAKTIDRLSLPGLPAERAPVLPGGLAVLCGVVASLDIDTMQATHGALREGLLYDLIGRVSHQDVRENSVRDLTLRYHIDQAHSRRVRETALGLLAQAAMSWNLTGGNDKLLLGWAADLHEIGMDIAHSQYHRHGGYLLQNMDLPGFSRLEQHNLALLVRAHRRKFPIEEHLFNQQILRLTVLLRLSVVLHRNRTSEPLPHIALSTSKNAINVRFPDQWLQAHPLTKLDLEQEAGYLKAIPIQLEICE